MIAALRRIEGQSAMPAIPGQVRAMLLDDPPRESWFSSLTATHPSIATRVAALVEHAGGRDVVVAAPTGMAAAAPPWSGAAKPATTGNPWWRGKA